MEDVIANMQINRKVRSICKAKSEKSKRQIQLYIICESNCYWSGERVYSNQKSNSLDTTIIIFGIKAVLCYNISMVVTISAKGNSFKRRFREWSFE